MFRYQFSLLAARRPRVAPPALPFVPYQRWQRVRVSPPLPVGLAAFKHQQRQEARARSKETWKAARCSTIEEERQRRRQHWERIGTRARYAENQPVRPRGRNAGHSSRHELYEWHKAMGTLELYFALFPP